LAGISGFVFEPLSAMFGWISHLLLSYELIMVRFFAHLPFASLNLPAFSFWIVVGFYLSYFIALVKFPSTFFQFKFAKKSST
jgi:hypothetical protein